MSLLVAGGFSDHVVSQVATLIEAHTQAYDPHPNATVFGAVLVLANLQRKGVPVIKAIADTAKDNPGTPLAVARSI